MALRAIGSLVITLTLLVYALAIAFGLRAFQIWDQVAGYLLVDNSAEVLQQLYDTGALHFERASLVFAVLELGRFLGVEETLFFSFFMLFLMYLTYVLVSQCLSLCHVRRLRHVFAFFFLIGLSFFMNGRLIFAFFGAALLLRSLLSRDLSGRPSAWVVSLALALALWALSVSTGSFSVGVLTALFYGIIILIRPGNNRGLQRLVVAGVLLGYLGYRLPSIKAGIEKNLEFHNDSFYEMMFHGPGKFIASFPLVFFVLIPLLCVAVLFELRFVRKTRVALIPGLMILASLFVGVFGYSSLLTGMPAFIVYAYLRLGLASPPAFE